MVLMYRSIMKGRNLLASFTIQICHNNNTITHGTTQLTQHKTHLTKQHNSLTITANYIQLTEKPIKRVVQRLSFPFQKVPHVWSQRGCSRVSFKSKGVDGPTRLLHSSFLSLYNLALTRMSLRDSLFCTIREEALLGWFCILAAISLFQIQITLLSLHRGIFRIILKLLNSDVEHG